MDYRKKHKVQLNIDMNPSEKEEFVTLIKKNGYNSNREFLLKCIEVLKEENNIFKKNDQ